jgi:hypothetical protein
MYCGFGVTGVVFVVVVPVKDKACKEQTKRASTPAERRRAQNNWAPKSRDPFNPFACFIKSSLERIVSPSFMIEACISVREGQYR